MKKAIAVLIVAVLLFGCCADKCKTHNCNQTKTTAFSSSFNQETYIWESFLFPTNRTTGAQ